MKFRYNEDLVEALKYAVDWREREWGPDGRCWWVDWWAVRDLAGALEAEGAEVRRVDAEGQPVDGPPPPNFAVPTWAEVVLIAVGEPHRDAVFRALSRVLHPDTETGDPDLMRERIAARELIASGDEQR